MTVEVGLLPLALLAVTQCDQARALLEGAPRAIVENRVHESLFACERLDAGSSPARQFFR